MVKITLDPPYSLFVLYNLHGRTEKQKVFKRTPTDGQKPVSPQGRAARMPEVFH